MSQPVNPFIQPDGTKASCMQMLQIILDEEATPEQKAYFNTHMDLCLPCFKTYEVDMTIKQMLKIKCCGDQFSHDMVEQLRIEIKQKLAR